MDFEGAKLFILDKLKTELKPNLYYHDINHTLDVYNSVVRISQLEKISSAEELLVKTASLFHDSGMLKTYIGHEEASCEIANETLPTFGYDHAQIDAICQMILTTKLPQSASGKMEMIICDADLDYLGRDDFYMISHRLKYEWQLQNFNNSTLKQWYELQVKFLSSHRYFTQSAIQTREAGKQKNLNEIKETLASL